MSALALGCISASAQQKLTLSTYKGTDLTEYSGKKVNVSVSRHLYSGWNTLSLPFSMSEAEVNEAFGNDCRLEKLVGVEKDGMGVKLNFQDCKAEGLKANTPYILHYTGENGTKRIASEEALISAGPASVSFTAEGTGETVTMAAAQQKTDATGLYGILARDNAEANFVSVDNIPNGFYATRCYVKLSGGNATLLSTNHIDASEVTSIATVAQPGERVEVFNLSGVKVADNTDGLQKGIYVVKGKKVMVK